MWKVLQSMSASMILTLLCLFSCSEFELVIKNGSWINAPDCQKIPHTDCDLTFDLGSDSDYNVRVRAQCGSRLSAWTKFPFNRNNGERQNVVILTPPIKSSLGAVFFCSTCQKQISVNRERGTTVAK